jgi:phage-related protein
LFFIKELRWLKDNILLWMGEHKRQWRDYRTANGRRPTVEFFDDLKAKNLNEDLVMILKNMKRVANLGLPAARHLRGDIYEVRTNGTAGNYRILFATEGRYSQVLLSLEAFVKKTPKTPPAKIKLAEDRLRDWRSRGSAAH